jgi:hypothetical protein
MRSKIKNIILLLLVGATICWPQTSNAQIIDAIEQAIIAAIETADVAVQEVQNATINLQNIQKQVEDDLSQTQLGQIANWTQQQKDLYSNYFSELWKVKTVISDFKAILDIINEQKQLVNEYQQAYNAIQQDKHFSPQEVQYIYNVFTGIVSESLKNVDEITLVIESFSVQMSDADRMKLIKHASAAIQTQIADMRGFIDHNVQVSMQRSANQTELNTIKQLYGISN